MNFILLAVLAADPNVVEIFKDKGDHFLRAGTNRGLKVGTEVIILGEPIGDSGEYRKGGKASVLEVWETLARVSPDEAARALKELRYARLSGAAPSAALAPVARPAPPPRPEPVAREPAPAPEPVAAPRPAAAPALKGHAAFGGIGPAKRITVYNDSAINWTNCDLRLPTNKRYVLSTLQAGDSEGIMITRFVQDGVQYDRPVDSIAVKCEEGQAKWSFSM